MELIRLEESMLQQAVVSFALAFLDYPQFACYFPSQDWRIRHFTGWCLVGLRFAHKYGEVYATPDHKATICWFPPGKTHFTNGMWLSTPGFLKTAIMIGWKHLSRVTTCEDYASKVHEETMPCPHWYL
jgi:hypothetical protein